MAEDNGGGNSPPVVELGDAPDLTRTVRVKSDVKDDSLHPSYPLKKTIIASWSSLEVFAKQFKGDNGSGWWARRNVRNSWSADFNGCDSFDEALDMAVHGWEEGGVACDKARGYIQALNPLSPKLVRYGIAGTTPNVPRAIAGNLLNMRQPKPTASMKKKTITIIYNMCENGGTDATMITNKAAVTAALIDEIEAKGFAVEVIASVVTNGHDYRSGSRGTIRAYEFVRVKESHHPVDINRLAFGLGHAAMFRGLFFADMQRNDEFKEIGEGLGGAASMQALKEHNEEQIYTISSAGQPISAGWFKDMDMSATTGLNAIVRELRLQGCPAFPVMTEKEREDALAKPEEDHSSYPNEYSY